MCGPQPGENESLREGRGPGMPGPYRVAMKKGEDDLQSYLEQAFGKSDVTSVKMRAAVREWFDLYYGVPRAGEDTAPRVAALIVGKLCRNAREMNERIGELMETVGLAPRFAHSYPHELDGGRRQRIGIARALATNPRFIVCDEPVSALDVSIQAQILNLLMDLQEDKGLSYMFITHDLSVVKHISSHIAVMYLGQCVEYAGTKELFANPLHPYTRALLAAIPVIDITRRGKRIETIQGEVTSPIEPAPGCRFAPRCAYATEACRQEQRLRQVSEGHWVACCRAAGEEA